MREKGVLFRLPEQTGWLAETGCWEGEREGEREGDRLDLALSRAELPPGCSWPVLAWHARAEAMQSR